MGRIATENVELKSPGCHLSGSRALSGGTTDRAEDAVPALSFLTYVSGSLVLFALERA